MQLPAVIARAKMGGSEFPLPGAARCKTLLYTIWGAYKPHLGRGPVPGRARSGKPKRDPDALSRSRNGFRCSPGQKWPKIEIRDFGLSGSKSRPTRLPVPWGS